MMLESDFQNRYISRDDITQGVVCTSGTLLMDNFYKVLEAKEEEIERINRYLDILTVYVI
jgi:hypothetical protein